MTHLNMAGHVCCAGHVHCKVHVAGSHLHHALLVEHLCVPSVDHFLVK